MYIDYNLFSIRQPKLDYFVLIATKVAGLDVLVRTPCIAHSLAAISRIVVVFRHSQDDMSLSEHLKFKITRDCDTFSLVIHNEMDVVKFDLKRTRREPFQKKKIVRVKLILRSLANVPQSTL